MQILNPIWQSCVSTHYVVIGKIPFILFLEKLLNLLSFLSDNEDPLIRGLALRSLCSLRLESIIEYVTQPLQKCFTDVSAYVRKAAVMGVLKVSINPPYPVLSLTPLFPYHFFPSYPFLFALLCCVSAVYSCII
jgi:hypothetical protein